MTRAYRQSAHRPIDSSSVRDFPLFTKALVTSFWLQIVTKLFFYKRATQLLCSATKVDETGFGTGWTVRLLRLLIISGLLLTFVACGGGTGNNPPPPPPPSFQLSVALTGTGTISSSPAGINCPSTCSASFEKGTSVTLTATAGAGFDFGGYGGACSGNSCQFVVSSDQSVSATFDPAPPQLTVTLSGQGTVTSTPAGINCPTVCTATFNDGDNVTLTASAGIGFRFSGYNGACSSFICQLTLSNTQEVNVNATFPQIPHDITAINHIIVITQENRSFDHYFGHLMDYWKAHGYPQATNGTTFDGEPADASNPDYLLNPTPAFNFQSACNENPSPSWNESHVDRNLAHPEDPDIATMDGFAHTAGGDAQKTAGMLFDVLGHRAMGYFTGDQLNYYYFMASNFATSDRWFSPFLSRTQLNRMFLYGATSQGHAYPVEDSTGKPLTSETIFQNMQDHGVSWKIYVHPDKTGCSTQSCLAGHSYLKQFTYNSYVLANLPNAFQTTDQLLTDMQNGTLPQVSFIEAAGYLGVDEHPTGTDVVDGPNVQAGAKYVSGIVNALMTSPSWQDTAVIFTYDEPGGFYDHVPPQAAVFPDAIEFPTDLMPNDICSNNTAAICGFGVTGFRLPLIVISPFTKANYVSHTVMDYTAILKFIETRFQLPNLSARDAAQPDMTEFFDFNSMAWLTPPTPPVQLENMKCVIEALNGITVTPNPAPAGGQATVTLSLVKPAIENAPVSLSASSPGVVPASTTIANGTTSTALTITVPTGITSLTITGSIGGLPVSGTVPVQ
jgi:phospholipase C